MNHTKEPWDVAPKSPHLIYSLIGDAIAECDGSVDGKSREWDHANAARIVACVNACAGIADPSAIPDAIHALQKIVEWAWEHLRKGEDGFMLERIDKTLAKLKGSA